MKSLLTRIIAVCAVAVIPSAAIAYRVPIADGACPDTNPNFTWREYLTSTKYGRAEIQFRTAKNVNDPAAIGGLDTRNCYNVRYHPETKTYDSWYTIPPGTGDPHPNTKEGLPGDPVNNEVNVYGVVLLFNEAGEVFNRKGEIVGQLVCYFSNECGGY